MVESEAIGRKSNNESERHIKIRKSKKTEKNKQFEMAMLHGVFGTMDKYHALWNYVEQLKQRFYHVLIFCVFLFCVADMNGHTFEEV